MRTITITYGEWGEQYEFDDGRVYLPKYPVKRWTSGSRESIEFDGVEVVNCCGHCQRADFRPAVASGWDDAIERGLMIPIEEVHRWPGFCPGCSTAADEKVSHLRGDPEHEHGRPTPRQLQS